MLVVSGSGNLHLVNFADDVLEHCDVCEAFDKAPHAPIARASSVFMFNELAQVDLFFLDDLVARRAMVLFPEYSLLFPVRPENPQGVWDVFWGDWLGACGPPKCLQMDAGGE